MDKQSQWSNENSLRANLERLLGFPLPTRSSGGDEAIEDICGICMAVYVDEKAPEKHCGNAHCHRVYHNVCLMAWLKQSGKARVTFNTVTGDCPYCSTAITATDSKYGTLR